RARGPGRAPPRTHRGRGPGRGGPRRPRIGRPGPAPPPPRARRAGPPRSAPRERGPCSWRRLLSARVPLRAAQLIALAEQPGTPRGGDDVDVAGEPAQVVAEPGVTPGLRGDAVDPAVVEDRAEPPPLIARDSQSVVDHDARDRLALRPADDARLLRVDEKSLLVANLVDPPPEPADRFEPGGEGGSQVVRVAGVRAAPPAGQAVKPGVEDPADEVREGRGGRRPLRQEPVAETARVGGVGTEPGQRRGHFAGLVAAGEPADPDGVAQRGE